MLAHKDLFQHKDATSLGLHRGLTEPIDPVFRCEKRKAKLSYQPENLVEPVDRTELLNYRFIFLVHL